MRQAYLDCSSGISGDMFLAAMIDAGLPVDRLFAELKKLPLGFYEFKRTRAVRGGIVGTRVDIHFPAEQPHRHLADIQSLLEKAGLPEKAARRALQVFNHLAEVEGKLHNIPPDRVHFHEVGAVDAIVDIVGACVGIEFLEVSDLICSPLNVGSGHVEAAHGSLPVPAPATAELLKGIPVYSTAVEGELVTPTGAALVAVLASGFGPLPAMKVDRIGYGAGEKEFHGHPNVARIFLGEPVDVAAGKAGLPGDEVISVIEANVEDMGLQAYADFLQRAAAAGALDVTSNLARSKTGRTRLTLSILSEPGKTEGLSQLLLEKAGTQGLRIYEARRKVADHEPVGEEPAPAGEIVCVVEATVEDMNPQAYGEFLEQAAAAGALDITSSPTRSKNGRARLALSALCEPGKADELSQFFSEKAATASVRVYEARRKVAEREPAAEPAPADELVSVIEASVNEMSPQLYGLFLEQALAAGALEVNSSLARTSTYRLGLTLSILCEPGKTDALSQLLFGQTATRSVRISEARRKVVEREQAVESAGADEIVEVIEANVDDMNPQIYGYFLEQALAAGALDVTCSSTQMKKNRPGLTLSLLCEPSRTEELSQLLFEQTTTIGVRIHEARRKVLEREQVVVETPFGEVKVKVARRDGKVLNAAPEFDDCRRLAVEKSLPLKLVIAAAEAAYLQQAEKVAGV